MVTEHRWEARAGIAWLWQGLVGGIISGIAFSVAASVVWLLQGQSWDGPFRLVAAVALGLPALEPTSPLLPALFWGTVLHLLYTGYTGVLFAALVTAAPTVRRSSGAVLVAALLYTLVLWLSNFYVIAPALGWVWFPERTDMPSQFLLNVGVWGGVLGGYLARYLVRTAPVLKPNVAGPEP